MDAQLQRLVYYSHNRLVGSPDEIARTIAAILTASRRNNATVGVTGALMFNSGCFAQILEGPRAAVEQTFERIQQDSRHGDVVVLAFDPVPCRSFSHWSMAFVGAQKADADRYGALSIESNYDPARMSAEAIFQVLYDKVLEEESVSAN